MLITAELLERYGACERGVEYVRHFYPNGASMIDIINDKNVEKEMLHWGRTKLSHSDEELAAYCKACGIVNSEGFWYSIDVRDSKNVIKSKGVERCERVFYSNDVTNSFDVVNGDFVDDSSQIFTSSMVDKSNKILHCANVSASENICFSTVVARSRNIYESKNVFDSSEIVRCDNVTASYFCQDCKNIKHCLFCAGIDDVEYHVFNQPVDKERFELFLQQYLRFMNVMLEFSPEWPENLCVAHAPSTSKRPFDWFKPVSSKFWKWARTLPGYDSMALYNMTYLPEILMEEKF